MSFEDSSLEIKLSYMKKNSERLNIEKFNYFLLSQNLYDTNNHLNYSCNTSFSSENNCFSFRKYSTLISNDFFEINPHEKLYFSFETKGINSPLHLYAGFIGFDENFQEISDPMVSCNPGSFTKLVKELSNQSKTIKVENVTQFSKGSVKIALFAKKHGKDLPNRNLHDIEIEDINFDDNELILKNHISLLKKIPVGTGIRIHNGVYHYYKYPGCYGVSPKDNWQKLQGVITGFQTTNNDHFTWRNGTKYAKIIFLINYEDKNDEKLTLIRNIKIYSKE